MTREQIIEKVQKIARGWYWTANVISTTIQYEKIITTFNFSSSNVGIGGFEATLIGDQPYTLLYSINGAILRLYQSLNHQKSEAKAAAMGRDIDEIEGLAQILEDAFYENYETGKDPSELIEVE